MHTKDLINASRHNIHDLSSRRARLSVIEEFDVEDHVDLSFLDFDSSTVAPLETTSPPTEADLVSAKITLVHFLRLDLLGIGEPQRVAIMSALSVHEASSTFSQSPAGQMFGALPAIFAESQTATATCMELSSRVSAFKSEKSKRDELIAQRTALSAELMQLNMSYDAKEELIKKLKAEVFRHEADLEGLLRKLGEALKSSVYCLGQDVEGWGVHLMGQKHNFMSWVKSLQEAKRSQLDCCMRWDKLRQVLILE